MDNNFEKDNVIPEENEEKITPMSETSSEESKTFEAEHVISYRTEDIPKEAFSREYSNVKREEATFTPNGTYPSYNAPKRSADGGISYTPASKEKKEKSGKGALVAVLVIVGIFLSMGCGMFGAYIGNELFISEEGESVSQNNTSGTVNSDGVVVYKAADVESSSEGSTLGYSEVVSVAADSVVAISTEYKNQGLWEYITEGAGSGVVMSEDGYIITNNHVVSRSDSNTKYADGITVRMKNGDEYNAEVIGGDPEADIAVLKVELEEGEKLKAAIFSDSGKIAVGEEVIAIGNPLGELSGTVTNGIISSQAREIEVEGVTMNLLQTNAAINPGNSGGGLFNMKGELIGIVNAKSSGTGIEGLGFAIPVNDALATAEGIIENGGSVTKASVRIGITTYNVLTAADAQKYGFNALGVYVIEVEEGLNDDVLKKGDRIIAVNGEEISSGSDVVAVVQSSKVGDKLEFIVYRKGKMLTLEVTCFAAE